MNNLVFEEQFKEMGIASQRRYPNEALIAFLASNYFNIPRAKRKKIKILELGVGSGANIWMMAREGFSAYGIDIASTGIKLCRQVLKSWGVRADVRVGDMTDIPFGNNFFDAIVDVVSVQHTDLVGHKETYAEAYRSLKKGGRIFEWHLGAGSTPFSLPGVEFVDRLTVEDIKDEHGPLHNTGATCFLTVKDARQMLKVAGFRDINIEIFTKTYGAMKNRIEYLSINAIK